MKLRILLILAVIGISVLLFAGRFYYQNLRGSHPAFGPANREPSVGKTDQNPPEKAKNTTGLPLTVPDGFSMSVFVKGLGGPRVLAFDPAGVLLVSIPSQGKVIALPDQNGDAEADSAVPVVEGLNRPHGLAFHDRKLYVAETDGVSSFDYNPNTMKATGKKKIVDLPGGGIHFTRTIGFGPDGKLYISVGSDCNVCNEKEWRRAKLLIAEPDGSGLREYASGLRNSVFFTWRPSTKDLWATDMGRDLIGDNVPPEEINIIKDGAFYGWPYCYGDKVWDRSFDQSSEAQNKCAVSTAPHISFQAHSAPLGLAFIPDSWPEEYRGDLLVSYHGSWNRTQPTGYKIARFDLDANGTSKGESDFISGWLNGNSASGRPVDLVFDTKGNLFASDDKSGVVYRVSVIQK